MPPRARSGTAPIRPTRCSAKKTVSPRWLGTVNSHSYFAAVKFEPSDTFKMVYKFDRNDDNGTPEGTGAVAYNPNVLAAVPGIGGFMTGILNAFGSTNNLYLTPSAKRPDIVTNGWVIPRESRVQGHSLTATWKASDSITVKNIAAYRKGFIFAPSAIDGISSLTVTPAVQRAFGTYFVFVTPSSLGGYADRAAEFLALPVAVQNAIADGFGAGAGVTPGKRWNFIASQASSLSKQWSDELQVNYSSEKLQATVGALWFRSEDVSGGPERQQNTSPLTGIFSASNANLIGANGVLPLQNEGRTFNQATSLAAYAQLEYKITPELEVVAGARITHDKKNSQFRWDTSGVAQTTINGHIFKKSKPNFLVGLNYEPNADTLLYAKWSNSFVSGGEVARLAYEPETANAFEVGAKVDFLDRKLRANLALFHVDYKHLQQSASPNFPPTDQVAKDQLFAIFGDRNFAEQPREQPEHLYRQFRHAQSQGLRTRTHGGPHPRPRDGYRHRLHRFLLPLGYPIVVRGQRQPVRYHRPAQMDDQRIRHLRNRAAVRRRDLAVPHGQAIPFEDPAGAQSGNFRLCRPQQR